MHVLHILEATRGGTRRHILDLLPALHGRGIACTLVASALRNPDFAADVQMLRAVGINVIEVPMARGMDAAGDAAALKAIGALLKTNTFDVIHCHSTKAGLLGRLARLVDARHLPLVYTPHCIAFDTGLPRSQRRAARILEKLLASTTSHYIAVSRRERHAILSRGLCQAGRVTTILNGIGLDEFDALALATRSDFGLGDDDFVVGCFGRLTRQKNQAALLRALPPILQTVPNARLFFVGGGEDEAALRALSESLGIAERTVWCGEQLEARPLYALCDVIAQPSRWEGCPYSILEAMAARRVVVANSVGGVDEILNNEYGLAYRSFDETSDAALAAGILKVADWATQAPGRLQERSRAARRRVEENFRLENMVDSTIEVYKQFSKGKLRK